MLSWSSIPFPCLLVPTSDRSYSDRMSFYLQKIFVCEYSGRSNLDYFEGLDSEWNESKKTQEKFPDPLKPRVLRACQFRESLGTRSPKPSRNFPQSSS